ncbi:homeobox knotted-like protein [Perilla frutescens var. frutescens]|nr:homeobox knotted-like protein [Perilla frutescens var. frutescens]
MAIDARLSHSHHILSSYAYNPTPSLSKHQRQELDSLLAQYLLVLCSFREKLHQHVRVDVVEAAIGCREIEHNLQSLIGVTLGEGSGATMSDDDKDEQQTDSSLDQTTGFDELDLTGSLGPLLPSETERNLMERVRQELKIELKQGFKSRIGEVREDILRKRRVGKLLDDTTTVLKNWWQQQSKWPYPTEDDKAKLVEETGLQLKQINNWFINQRKHKWQNSNSLSPFSRRTKHNKSAYVIEASKTGSAKIQECKLLSSPEYPLPSGRWVLFFPGYGSVYPPPPPYPSAPPPPPHEGYPYPHPHPHPQPTGYPYPPPLQHGGGYQGYFNHGYHPPPPPPPPQVYHCEHHHHDDGGCSSFLRGWYASFLSPLVHFKIRAFYAV